MKTEYRDIRFLASNVASDFQKAEKSLKSQHFCRCDGIGRRDGLKIRWTYHPCGFESHHRHHGPFRRALFLSGSGAEKCRDIGIFTVLAESRRRYLSSNHPFYRPLSVFSSCSLHIVIFAFPEFLTPHFARYSVIFPTFGSRSGGQEISVALKMWRPR